MIRGFRFVRMFDSDSIITWRALLLENGWALIQLGVNDTKSREDVHLAAALLEL
jgi:hypothetical protein